MQPADASVAVPTGCLRLKLSAAAGWAVYAGWVDLFTALGAGLRLRGNLLNLRRARTVRRANTGRRRGPRALGLRRSRWRREPNDCI